MLFQGNIRVIEQNAKSFTTWMNVIYHLLYTSTTALSHVVYCLYLCKTAYFYIAILYYCDWLSCACACVYEFVFLKNTWITNWNIKSISCFDKRVIKSPTNKNRSILLFWKYFDWMRDILIQKSIILLYYSKILPKT